MSEEIIIEQSLSKEEKYKSLLPQIHALVEGEASLITNLAQICAALKYSMDKFFWVGFYFVHGNDLVLQPFQGPVACSRITIPNGVCGACVQRMETIIVQDVDKFPGHIACSSLSRSEIVAPVFDTLNNVVAVLDIDSDVYNNFDETDKFYIEELCVLVSGLMQK
jgi:L-methionine (R)-S-oxide reductase